MRGVCLSFVACLPDLFESVPCSVVLCRLCSACVVDVMCVVCVCVCVLCVCSVFVCGVSCASSYKIVG